MQNAKQYCALHGYDYLTTPKSYPLLTGEQGSRKNPSVTEFPFLRAALPLYDWIYRKQADTMFVNFSIPLESLIQLMPEDTHFGYPITRDRWLPCPKLAPWTAYAGNRS